MKIITLEEHLIDQEIAEAAKDYFMNDAPYMKYQSAVGSVARDIKPERPYPLSDAEISRLGSDLGEERLCMMDQYGITMQVISCSSPVQFVSGRRGIELARKVNNRISAAVKNNPERFSGLAMLPWQDPAAAIDELERCVNSLGLKGVLLVGRPGDKFLDAPEYQGVLKALAKKSVPLYIHPFPVVKKVNDVYYDGLTPVISALFALGGWGWHHEAGIQTLRLILSGAFENYPGLTVISGHWGEMVPFYLHRLDEIIPKSISGLTKSILETYKENIFVTPSGMFDLPHFKFIYEVLGADRIMWSCDYPYFSLDGAKTFLSNLPINGGDLEKIAYKNAEKLLKL